MRGSFFQLWGEVIPLVCSPCCPRPLPVKEESVGRLRKGWWKIWGSLGKPLQISLSVAVAGPSAMVPPTSSPACHPRSPIMFRARQLSSQPGFTALPDPPSATGSCQHRTLTQICSVVVWHLPQHNSEIHIILMNSSMQWANCLFS